MKQSLKIIISILIPLIVGGVSAAITASEIPTWYLTLNKPSFNPPNYLFGPVWTTLYILMGISWYMISKTTADRKSKLVVIYILQLILNFLWSIIFFGFHAPFMALIEISLLWITILVMIINFYKENKVAGLLQIPYLLWVSFATTLNFAIWQLN